MSSTGATQDELTRIRAYHLWEADGRPQGREEEFWERARELIAIEDSPTVGQLPQSHAGQSDSRPRATRGTNRGRGEPGAIS
jgi:hypothetical protein